MSTLVIYVRLHDGRYNGRSDWPPSPARLFQALVAGAGLGGPLRDTDRIALKWLERQPPPIIGAPCGWRSRRRVLFYMPNNDTDVIEGDPSKMGKIRTATKIFQPYLFDPSLPFLYAWETGDTPEDQQKTRVICSLAERLYQLGRSIDMAWAWGEAIEGVTLHERLLAYPGRLFRPSLASSGLVLASPCRDSLDSLDRRYQAFGKRFAYERDKKGVKVVFRNPPPPKFLAVAYLRGHLKSGHRGTLQNRP